MVTDKAEQFNAEAQGEDGRYTIYSRVTDIGRKATYRLITAAQFHFRLLFSHVHSE